MHCRFPNMDCYLRSVPASNSSPLTIDATVPLTWHIHAPLFLSFAQPRTKLIATVRDPLDLLDVFGSLSACPCKHNWHCENPVLMSSPPKRKMCLEAVRHGWIPSWVQQHTH